MLSTSNSLKIQCGVVKIKYRKIYIVQAYESWSGYTQEKHTSEQRKLHGMKRSSHHQLSCHTSSKGTIPVGWVQQCREIPAFQPTPQVCPLQQWAGRAGSGPHSRPLAFFIYLPPKPLFSNCNWLIKEGNPKVTGVKILLTSYQPSTEHV